MHRAGAAGVAGWGTLAALTLFAFGGAAGRPGGLLLGLPSVPAVALCLLVVGLLAVVLGRAGLAGAAASVGLLPVALLLLSGLRIPGTAALSGPPILALVLAGVALTFSVARPDTRRLFFPLVFAVYLFAAGRVQVQVGAEGDEPHYLMVTESLLRDGDLSLERDYAEGRYRAFCDRPLAPHYRVRGKGGEIYSLHALGLSLLVLPAYALGGYPAASFFMALMAALLAREIRRLICAWTGEVLLAEGVAWAVAFSPPLIHYAGLVFTEVPAALILALVLRRGRDTAGLNAGMGALLGTAVAFLPWLNVRYAILVPILLAYVLAGRPQRRTALALLLPSVASAVALGAYHYALYGFFDPRRVYGSRPEFSLGTLPEGLPGLLFDQEFGLLVYAPIFALAAPGLIALRHHGVRLVLTASALVAVVVLTAGTWHMWRGGWNPPARFLLPIVPLLAVGVAVRLRRGLGGGAALLVGWGLFLGLAGGLQPRLVHRDRDGTAPLFRTFSGAEEWTRLLPGYVLAEPDRHRLALVWTAALGLVAVGGTWPRRGPAATLALGIAGLLVAAGTASALSEHRTGGRDAVRLVGRRGLVVPGWNVVDSAAAHWQPTDLEWGPLYEPHRHPSGVEVGSRLELPMGRYRLLLTGEAPPSDPTLLQLGIRPDKPGSLERATRLGRVASGWLATFDVTGDNRAVTLVLRGGGPLLLRGVMLQRSTFGATPGLIQ